MSALPPVHMKAPEYATTQARSSVDTMPRARRNSQQMAAARAGSPAVTSIFHVTRILTSRMETCASSLLTGAVASKPSKKFRNQPPCTPPVRNSEADANASRRPVRIASARTMKWPSCRTSSPRATRRRGRRSSWPPAQGDRPCEVAPIPTSIVRRRRGCRVHAAFEWARHSHYR